MSTPNPDENPGGPDPREENTMDETDFDRTLSEEASVSEEVKERSDEVPNIEGYQVTL